jgi:chromate transporter
MFEVLLAFLRLGCMSFGGPAAHLGYFRDEFVRRRRWLTEAQFAQCVAITQLLPGPGSSQTGMLVGLIRAGWPGALGAWIGFTLPSAALMTAFALLVPGGLAHAPWVHGLLIVAAAVVAQAISIMRRTLIPDLAHLLLAFATLAAMLAAPFAATAPLAIAVCALTGMLLPGNSRRTVEPLVLPVSRTGAAAAMASFGALLVALPLLAHATGSREAALAAALYDVGSLVFGGGHVVLPLLQTQVVGAGIASAQSLIAGYAAAQAIPGPLFTLSSYIGAIAYHGSMGIAGAAIATFAIFLPSFFLIAAVAPFYAALAGSERFARALTGANAGVVGLLASAFVRPVWTNAIHSPLDVLLAAAAFAALTVLRWPSWAVVALGGAAGLVFFR